MMMTKRTRFRRKPIDRKTAILALSLIGAAAIAWMVLRPLADWGGSGERGRVLQPAPVEVAPIVRGPIELRRTYSGTLEARAEFVVAPKVSGRVERLNVNLADTVRRGQVAAAQRDLLGSSIDEVKAIVNYRIALVRLYLAEGSLLERRGVLLPAVRTGLPD